jgi:hypothetical protein
MGDWAHLLSRRDERTQPGVLTPGTVNFVVRPERATDGFRGTDIVFDYKSLPPLLGRVVI